MACSPISLGIGLCQRAGFSVYFLAKQLTVQNQPELPRSSHKALCLTSPWYFQNSKWSNLPVLWHNLQFSLQEGCKYISPSGKISPADSVCTSKQLPYLQVLELLEGGMLLITQSLAGGRKFVALLSVLHSLLRRSEGGILPQRRARDLGRSIFTHS